LKVLNCHSELMKWRISSHIHIVYLWILSLLRITDSYIWNHSSMDVKIHDSRKKIVQAEFDKPYFLQLKNTLLAEKRQYAIFPPEWLRFNAFENTPFDKLRVVLIGQDPYHGPWQAMWLSFSVPWWIALPPSLQNIYKEITEDVWITMPKYWDLTWWAQQWVLLLNATLTVRSWNASSHQKIWREQFTDAAIASISQHKNNVVFVLWGNFARSKKHLIDVSKHLVLEAAHPSPLSAYNWFFWCKHFSKTNEYIIAHWWRPIDRNIYLPQ